MKTVKIQIPHIYKNILEGDSGYYDVAGGRISGKTKNGAICAMLSTWNYPNTDIIIARANYTDLETSLYNELIDIISETNTENLFTIYKQPLRIERKDKSNVIYFTGIAGRNGNRTKGIKTKHPVSVVIFDEAQEIPTQNEYEQALASFRRRLGISWKIITIFNPPAQNAHWINVWFNLKKQDKDHKCFTTTYLDILDFISDIDLKEIVKDKLYNYQHYKWFYMGETGGGFGSVYPMFNREKHLIPHALALTPHYKYLQEQIVGMIIGVDGAVNHDATSFVPVAILRNGITMVLNIFHHDPLRSGIYGSQLLVEKYVSVWFKKLIEKYNLNDRSAYVPIIFAIDSASTELIQACKYFFSDRAEIISFKKTTIPQMVDVVQGAISKNMCYIIDFGGYTDFVQNRFVKADNPLAVALSNLVWNDKQTGYNPIIPNDDSDAFTYAINYWFKNPENIHWVDIAQKLKKDYYDFS